MNTLSHPPIKFLTIHCAATPEGRDVKAATISAWDKAKFGQTSYHHVVELDGTAVRTLADSVRGAHVGGGVAVTITITITTNGTAAGAILATLPVASASSAIICGRENAVTGMMCQGYVASGASSVSITKYDNTYPGGNAYIIILSGVYEV